MSSERSEETSVTAVVDGVLPWHVKPLGEWSICGMNHYRAAGVQRLYVAMTRRFGDLDVCVQSEGTDDWAIWHDLAEKATRIEQRWAQQQRQRRAEEATPVEDDEL